MIPAVDLRSFRARVDPAALLERRVALEVEAARIRLSGEGLALLRRPDIPVHVERVAPERLHLRVNVKGEWLVEARPVATSAGRLRLELVSVRPAFFSLLAIPEPLVRMALRNIPPQPGLHVTEDGAIEIAPGEASAAHGITLPPLMAVRAEDGILDLQF